MNRFVKNAVSLVSSVAIILGVFNGGFDQLFNNEVEEENLVYVEDEAVETTTSVQVEYPVTPIGLIRVTTSALNVRETPNGKVKGVVNQNEIAYFYGFSGNWIQILKDGQYGFVYSKYTDIYDFTYNVQSIKDVHSVFGTNEALASKQLSGADITILNNYEEIHRNELNTRINTASEHDAKSVTLKADDTTALTAEQKVALSQAEELAKQQAEAQAAILAEQQAAIAQAEELAKQQAEAQAAAIAQAEELARQQAEAQAAAIAQAEELARQQAEAQAAILAEQQKALQEALAAQQAEEAKKQALIAKNPATLSTPELCQYVLAQIITPGMDDFAKATAINNWLCDHMTYDLNYYTTRDAILKGRGRCQGYANAYKNLMNTAGIPTDYISGYGKSGRHGWNRVLINGAYYYVDVTWNDSTGNYSKYLLLSEAEMNRDHHPTTLNPRTE